MHKRNKIVQKLIHFFRWTRKKFAVLASLGKLIKIGVVRIEVCKQALLKSGVSLQSLSGNFVNQSSTAFDEDELIVEPLLTATTFVLPKVTSSSRLRKKTNRIIPSLFTIFSYLHRCYSLIFMNSGDQPINNFYYAN